MPVDLSIKRVPDVLAERLRKRAKRNHRSLQGELMAILQDALAASSPAASPPARAAHVRETAAPATPYSRSHWDVAPRSESALMIREDRDGRTFTVQDLYDHVSSLGPCTPDESTAWIRRMRSSR